MTLVKHVENQALDLDERNVPMLMKRATLHECMEDYKKGAADLSLVLTIEPRNQLANVGLTRLKKLICQFSCSP